MTTRIFWLLTISLFPVLVAGCTVAGGDMAFDQWANLFNGRDLTGWHISTRNHHGDSKGWKVVDGVIEGSQDRTGNGGIVLTDVEYGNFILEIEVNPDWGLDSGIFLRSTESGKCYQIMVDYYEGGNVGGIYGEGTGGFKADAADWQKFYKKGEWNKILAIVMGNPATIEVWLNGQHVVSWKGKDKVLDDKGHIGLQVHAGNGYFGKVTRFRNIRVRELE